MFIRLLLDCYDLIWEEISVTGLLDPAWQEELPSATVMVREFDTIIHLS